MAFPHVIHFMGVGFNDDDDDDGEDDCDEEDDDGQPSY